MSDLAIGRVLWQTKGRDSGNPSPPSRIATEVSDGANNPMASMTIKARRTDGRRSLDRLVRTKAAYPEERTATVTDYEVKCPHCKTLLRGGIGNHILRMACYHCQKPMNLLWP
jgi:hypothetical protein